MHQPSGQAQGQAADIAIQAEQIVYLKRMMAERIAFHTGQPVERIEADSDRDRWFTAAGGQGLRLHRPGHRAGRRRDRAGLRLGVVPPDERAMDVRARGLEPPPLSGPGPKPGASTSFATPA